MIYCLKKYKFFLMGISISILIILLIVGLFSVDNSTNEMIVNYLNSNGITVDKKPIQISHLTIPNTFDKIYETYNNIQLESGFDLTPYKGKAVMKYTYCVTDTNHVNTFANIFLYNNEIIAADISSSGSDGFIKAVKKP